MEAEPKKINPTLLFALVALIVFSAELFYRHFLFDRSLDLISWTNSTFPDWFRQIAFYCSFLATSKAYIPIAITVLNFGNTYKGSLFVAIVFMTTYLAGFFKLIYSAPRPIFVDSSLFTLSCEGGWGNPSEHVFSCTIVYLSLYQVLAATKTCRNSPKTRHFLYFLTITFILSMLIFRVVLGVHSINQVLFGLQLGFLFYYWVFHILEVSLNNTEQFLNIVKLDLTSISVSTLILVIMPTIFFLYSLEDKIPSNYMTNLAEICPDISETRQFSNEAWIKTSAVIGLFFMLLGLKCELSYLNSGNEIAFIKKNFSIEAKYELISQLYDENSDYQWNHTSLKQSILRFFVYLTLIVVLIMPFFLVPDDINVYLFYLVKGILPACLVGFCNSFIAKYIFIKLNLVIKRY